jgi:hypothetical protein
MVMEIFDLTNFEAWKCFVSQFFNWATKNLQLCDWATKNLKLLPKCFSIIWLMMAWSSPLIQRSKLYGHCHKKIDHNQKNWSLTFGNQNSKKNLKSLPKCFSSIWLMMIWSSPLIQQSKIYGHCPKKIDH